MLQPVLVQRGENPLAGWTPSVPKEGFDLDPGTEEYKKAEELGLLEVEQTESQYGKSPRIAGEYAFT